MHSVASREGVPAAAPHRLTADEVPAAAEVLARTFADHPFVNWCVR